MDTFLKVWAILGPLLAAAASAVWSRHVQLSDRTHSDSREDLRLTRADKAAEMERQHSLRKADYEEAKVAIAQFMSTSHLFVRRQTDYLSHIQDAQLRQEAEAANEEFTRNGQLVILLGDEALENAAIALWNSCLALPRPTNPASPTLAADFEQYRTTRAQFNQEAKRFLAALKRAEA